MSCIIAGCYNWSDAQVAETKRRGDIVQHALDQYRGRTGSFPEKLEALVPEYLGAIPQPTVGKKSWIYETYLNNSAYLLSVAIRSEHEPELHAGSTGEWVYDTK